MKLADISSLRSIGRSGVIIEACARNLEMMGSVGALSSAMQRVARERLHIGNSWDRRPMRLWRTIHASRGRAGNEFG